MLNRLVNLSWKKTWLIATLLFVIAYLGYNIGNFVTNDLFAFYFQKGLMNFILAGFLLVTYYLWQHDLNHYLLERPRTFRLINNLLLTVFILTMAAIVLAKIISNYFLPDNAELLTNRFLDTASLTLFFTGIGITVINLPKLKVNTLQESTNKNFLGKIKDWLLRHDLLILLLITTLGLVLRSWRLDYYQGSDNFNFLAAKSLVENGSYIYDRTSEMTQMMAMSFRIFGTTLAAARIPSVLFGTLAIPLLYVFCRKIADRKIGLLAAFLLAVSPVAIEKSTQVREYPINLVMLLLYLVLSSIIYKKYVAQKKFIIIFGLFSTFYLGIIFLHSKLFSNSTIMQIPLVVLFFALPFLILYCKHNFPKLVWPSVVLVGFAFLVVFDNIDKTGMFLSNLRYEPYWFKIFFEPMITFPMQWFSFSRIGMPFLLFVFALPLLFKRDQNLFLYPAFILTVLIFVAKFNNFLGYVPTRYLYLIYPFYIGVFAIGLKELYNFRKLYRWPLLFSAFFLVFLLAMVIIPANTLHGVKHDLSLTDPRRPTSLGTGEYYRPVFAMMERHGVSKDSVLVVRGESPFFPTWHFDYPITRYYTTGLKIPYETGDKVYVVDENWGPNELAPAVREFKSGFLLAQSVNLVKKNIYIDDIELKYLDFQDDYYLYKWEY